MLFFSAQYSFPFLLIALSDQRRGVQMICVWCWKPSTPSGLHRAGIHIILLCLLASGCLSLFWGQRNCPLSR